MHAQQTIAYRLGLLLIAVALPQSLWASDKELYQDLYRQLKPLLTEKCIACHGPVRAEAGLRLDTAALIRQGSSDGAIVDSNHPDDSKILVRVQAKSDQRMPPEGEGVPLKAQEIAALRDWIAAGMPSPEHEETVAGPADHWAFRPIVRPTLPNSGATNCSPIDQLIQAVQQQREIVALPEADRATQLRRLTLGLTGLPPTVDEQLEFAADNSTDAYQRRVDQLLNRSTYGERWGRHWMDVWRYSDWDGYKEELRGSQRNIWHWRDWIIESLNDNKPYDQMVVEMLAADELYPTNAKLLRATGYLARSFHKSNRNIWLDATVEHTAKAFLGLTINCAKCHDHKYDPVAQTDYYRFRAIFEPHRVRTDNYAQDPGIPRAYDADLTVATYVYARGDDKHPIKDKAIESAVPSLLPIPSEFAIAPVQLPAESYAPELMPTAEREALAKAWQRIDTAQRDLDQALKDQRKLDLDGGAGQPVDIDHALLKLREAEASLASLKARYAADKAKTLGSDSKAATALSDNALQAEQRWKELDAQLKVAIATAAVQAAQKAVGSETNKNDAKRKAAMDKATKELTAAQEALQKLTAADGSGRLKEYTPIVQGYPKESTGRRAALARWIVDRRNPLTARVAVNHVWSRHFGSPLVENVFDFGLKTPKPELLQVLDWLAAEFIDCGWDMKHLHRLIVNSNAYRRASSGDGQLVSHARRLDPDNRLLWRFDVRRLDAEEVRDSVLAVGRLLDATMGGPDLSEDDGERLMRRSVYFRHAYEKQMTMMVMFDAASPNECYRRKPSVIPQQALVLANSLLARHASRKLAMRIWEDMEHDGSRFVRQLFLETLNRPPTDHEHYACLTFLDEQLRLNRDVLATNGSTTDSAEGESSKSKVVLEPPAADPHLRACQSLAHVMLNHNDFVNVR